MSKIVGKIFYLIPEGREFIILAVKRFNGITFYNTTHSSWSLTRKYSIKSMTPSLQLNPLFMK